MNMKTKITSVHPIELKAETLEIKNENELNLKYHL